MLQEINRKKRPIILIAGCSLLNFSLGSFYAWSVFLEPLQQTLAVSRSEVSAVFSFATICFTLGVLFGAPVYRRVRAAAVASGALLVGALGIAVAAGSMSLPVVIVGYGIIYGIANGVGYNLTLQLINTELQHNTGVATGFVTACYAVGSVVSAPILVYAIEALGVWNTFYALALFLLFAAVIVGMLLVLAGTTMACPPVAVYQDAAPVNNKIFVVLWFGFGLGAMAGLMVIGHAAGIISAYGGAPAQIALGTMFVNIGNVTGRLSGGWLSQHFPARRVLTVVMASAATVLLALAFFPIVWVALVAMLLIGFAYGANACTYPLSVSVYFGREQLAKVFGMLMTAWGIAGLTAPWIAGVIYDGTGQYRYAILVAAAAALAGSIISLVLPEKRLSEPAISKGA
ncbi:MFS transporter [Dethiobacter alkaliphilus]|uniref:Major facilitator superfamily MFS_1 n=1 Tax=Dethiobacter alkaliphilus AHT 1 TaxID=555088 RepID=C0GC83_DETAL|nr:MFS transporter [Dethiobacter alkaliphilus]EEG78818.1 major facilitator superfamily MFS_1 [Dethiobacter alkaliphilus AHT 1]